VVPRIIQVRATFTRVFFDLKAQLLAREECFAP
jgi:hypothetical protein